MSRSNFYLGKSLESISYHTDRTKVFRLPNREINRFFDMQSNHPYQSFQPFDVSYRTIFADELQEDTMLSLDFFNKCIITDKYKSLYFLETEEEKREAYHQEDLEDKSLATNKLHSDTFYNADLKEKKIEPKKSYTPLFTGPSLLEKLAGTTRAEMTYALEKNRSKHKFPDKCSVKVSYD